MVSGVMLDFPRAEYGVVLVLLELFWIWHGSWTLRSLLDSVSGKSLQSRPLGMWG